MLQSHKKRKEWISSLDCGSFHSSTCASVKHTCRTHVHGLILHPISSPMPGVHQRMNPTSNHGANLSVLSACPWPWLHADHPPPGGRYKTMTLDNVHLSYEGLLIDPINYEHCFLCWTPLTDDNKTDEHVFPKWMQEEFSLFSQPLTLPNKTWISYRQVRIPCCRRCNNEALSRLEQTVASAVRSGFDDFARNVSMKEQFLWLQCLFYKMLYRDMSLLSDRADQCADYHLAA